MISYRDWVEYVVALATWPKTDLFSVLWHETWDHVIRILWLKL